MTTRDYDTPLDSNQSTTKKIEVHGSSHCTFHKRKLKKNGVEVYVWFRFCYCGNEEFPDRSEEYKKIADGDSSPWSYSINGIYVHSRKECQHQRVTWLSWSGRYKIEEVCHCQ